MFKSPPGRDSPMFSLIRWLFALLLCLVVIGLFRGWFSFSRADGDPTNEQVNVNVSVDTAKVKTDAQRAGHLAEKVARRIKERRDDSNAQTLK